VSILTSPPHAIRRTSYPKPPFFSGRPRQGLNRVARKGALALPAWRGGDLGSHRKPAGQPMGHRGQPVKARSRPKNRQNHFNGAPYESLACPWPLCLACTAIQHQSA